MTCDELLYEIQELLTDGNHAQASDLLAEFIFCLPQAPSKILLGKYGDLTSGSPKDITNRLRNIFEDNNLISVNSPIDGEDGFVLTKSDLDLIDETEYHIVSSAMQYVLDEENIAPEILPLNVTSPVRNTNSNLKAPGSRSVSADTETKPCLSSPSQLVQNMVKCAELDEKDDVPLSRIGTDMPEEILLDPGDFDDLDDLDFDDFPAVSADVYGSELLVDHDFDPYEFTGHQERDNLAQVDYVDRLSRSQRARQVAVIMAVCYQLGQEGADLLGEIFEANGWSAARVAIENLIKSGTSLETLSLAKELKNIWVENDSYALAFLRLGNRTGYCTYHGGRVLSWQMAVKIVNLFPNGEIEEVERFLDRAFDHWYENDHLKFEFNVFLNYLKHLIASSARFGNMADLFLHDGDLCEEFEYEADKFGFGRPAYCDLIQYGLIPDFWNRPSPLMYIEHPSTQRKVTIFENDEDEECDEDA